MKRKKMTLQRKLSLTKANIATLNAENANVILGGATFTSPECVPTARVSCLGCPPPTARETCLGTCYTRCWMC
ncbi:MAG TPA: class I lanthipeptide [Chitinophaga sp.]|uniref:class I lanthipeptide n=1 Tax=Chitinophaga sp. TaxID=1869181 RepID=UPI002B51F6A7|nr:class I lanthipeptide [Chitinophaga sp.]HVI44698.1 class I lanthipeptide [Chitinophaga sp.]